MVFGRNRRKEKQRKARDEAEIRQQVTSLVSDDDVRRLRRVESDYSRERLHHCWSQNLQQIVNKAAVPTSHWWTQYVRMATVRTARYVSTIVVSRIINTG